MRLNPSEVARHVQHTNVRPDATWADIERLLDECLEHGFDGAMVNAIWIPLAADRLQGSGAKTCTALDFPMGGGTAQDVSRAAASARMAGADEIDVMTKVGWLKSGMDVEYAEHLVSVVAAGEGVPVKAMLEAVLLSPEELARAVELCAKAGIAWLKNSSGFDGGKATPEIVGKLVRLAAGRMRVKASGGIRTLDAVERLLEAGAELLGSSAGVALLSGERSQATDY
jgi:deoxyribose-phosphate aldolase